jgi:hypothetical protein
VGTGCAASEPGRLVLDEAEFKKTLVENQALIDGGHFDLNKPIKDNGSTFLHTAVWYQKRDLVRAAPAAVRCLPLSPHACQVKFLLAHGANPNVQNSKGNTPLHFAVSGSRAIAAVAPAPDVLSPPRSARTRTRTRAARSSRCCSVPAGIRPSSRPTTA